MKKKLMILLTVALAASLSACGSNSEIEKLKEENKALKEALQNGQANTATAIPTAAAAPTTAPTAAPTAVPAAAVAPPASSVLKDNVLEFNFIDPSLFSAKLLRGIYKCGTDFPEGEYCIVSLCGLEADYDPSNTYDGFTKPKDMIIRRVTPKTGQFVKLENSALIPAAEISALDPKSLGVFAVGQDLPAGLYKVETITSTYQNDLAFTVGISGAYQISSSPFANVIKTERVSDKQKYITLADGQYLIINNLRLTFSE